MLTHIGDEQAEKRDVVLSQRPAGYVVDTPMLLVDASEKIYLIASAGSSQRRLGGEISGVNVGTGQRD